MLCNNCNKLNPKGSNYCQHCGNNLKEKNKDKPKTENIKISKNSQSLWDKFVEIYDSKNEEKKIYLDLMSNEAWELIDRISVNTFEKFIEENKEQLNKLPYKVIEQIKNVFNWSVTGGYWMWYVEKFYNKEKITEMKHITIDALKDEWNEYAFKKSKETYDSLSQDLLDVMNLYHNVRINYLMENESIKELTNETIEKLKTALIFNIIWGYSIALAEKKYRK